MNASSGYSLWEIGDKTRYANFHEACDHFIVVDGKGIELLPQVDLRFDLIYGKTGMTWIEGIEKRVGEIHRIFREESQDSLNFEIRSTLF